ncbi:hypothetical protein AC1031_009813 [Aphanomyces cochlioides]|nr:hypothetical protein AC1031_009813 [Aphanomyces cochlioides]
MASHKHDPDAAIDSQGQVLGDYVLGKTIGRGTFGKVKIGMHLSTGEKVAVKILEKCRILEIADAERVAREIKILKRNFHSNVIQLYQVIDTSEAIYLVMEYIDGGEMFEYIVKHHRIREKEAVFMFLQIVEALNYLHQNDVTHRDLKPENLLLQSSNGSAIVVKVVDFGLSNTHENGRHLQTACGSPCYAAPEMIEGRPYIGPKADIWSLGVVLFAMVCGYLPFEDNNTSVLYKKILSGQYKAPNYISPAVQDLIRRILETDPDKRYTLADIRSHAWCKTLDMPLPLNAFASRGEQAINQQALSKLEELGLKREYVIEAIQKGVHTAFSAAYYLMLNKVNRPVEPKVHRRRYSAYNQPKKNTNNIQAAMDEAIKATGKPAAHEPPVATTKIPPKQEPAPVVATAKATVDTPKQPPPPKKDVSSTPQADTRVVTEQTTQPKQLDPIVVKQPNLAESPQTSTNEHIFHGAPTATVKTQVVQAASIQPTKAIEVPDAATIAPKAADAQSPSAIAPRANEVQGYSATASKAAEIQEATSTAPSKDSEVLAATPTATKTTDTSAVGRPQAAAVTMEPIVPCASTKPPSGRGGRNIVEPTNPSTTTPSTTLQPVPPTDSKDVKPKARATITMCSVLEPLAHPPQQLTIAAQAKNLMPFNSNAPPTKPQTGSIVAKKRAARQGSLITPDVVESTDNDLEMMKILVNRESYGTAAIREEPSLGVDNSIRLDTSESTLLPNASSVLNVIKASSSRSSPHEEQRKLSSGRLSIDAVPVDLSSTSSGLDVTNGPSLPSR